MNCVPVLPSLLRIRSWLGLVLGLLVASTVVVGAAGTEPVDPVKPATIRLLAPKSGARFVAPGPVVFEAEAVDPLGDIRHLDFHVGERRIGVSDFLLKIAVIPGRPIPHRFEWKDVPVGTHKVVAQGKDTRGKVVTSEAVVVEVVSSEPVRPLPVVSLVATRPSTAEPAPHIRVVPGQFTVSRTGTTDVPLRVGVRFGGTATAGADYAALESVVVIPAGSTAVTLEVQAVDDDLREPTETVEATLLPVSYLDPLALVVQTYRIDAARMSARVEIFDSDKDEETKAWLLNLNFGLWKDKTGPAAAGNGPGDYWNPWEHVYQPDVSVKDLRLSTGAASGVALRVRNAGGSWNNDTGDGMYDSYVYPNSGRGDGVGDMLLTLTGVPAGTYDLYLYGHADPGGRPEANSMFTASAGDQQLGPLGTRSSAGWKAEQGWNPGAQYVLLRGLRVAGPEQSVEIVVAPGANGQAEPGQVAVLNGLQLIGAGGVPPAGASLTLRSPTNGASFATGASVVLRAVAVDPKGYISRVTFHDGQTRIGVSEITFIRAPDPGTPIEHEFEWKGAPVGRHALTARATDSTGAEVVSAVAQITVGESGADRQVVLAVSAARAEAVEPGAGTEAVNGVFVIRRVAGARDVGVYVSYAVDGSALNGTDYAKLPGEVLLPAGRDNVEVVVRPLADKALEGEEKVVLTLRPIPCIAIFPPPPECYRIEGEGQATVVIRDAQGVNQAPRVAIVSPRTGSVVLGGESVVIRVEASDADGSIARVDLMADGRVMHTGTQPGLDFEWKEPAVGTHRLSAKAVDDRGLETVSAPVTFSVRDRADLAFVRRELPPAYLPGGVFEVVLQATPPRTAGAWTVEDAPPAGWTAAVSGAEAGLDAATGRVRFGPFTGSAPLRLTYRVTPAREATGAGNFTGTASLDGRTFPVVGEGSVAFAGERHPADASPADGTLVADEVTAYAAAWKSGRAWGADGGGIPAAYLTRAGQIWRQGGRYVFRPTAGAPPECWVPGTGATSAGLAGGGALGGAVAVRRVPAVWRPGVGAAVTVSVQPLPGAEALCAEETVPVGWRVTRVSEGGEWDPASGRVRWGLMFGDQPREVSYDVVPPLDAASNGTFSGRVSVDGTEVAVRGPQSVGASDASTALRIAGSTRGERGGIRLRVQALPEQVFAVEASTDLVTWDEVGAYLHTGDEIQVEDPAAASGATRYYRLRPLGR